MFKELLNCDYIVFHFTTNCYVVSVFKSEIVKSRAWHILPMISCSREHTLGLSLATYRNVEKLCRCHFISKLVLSCNVMLWCTISFILCHLLHFSCCDLLMHFESRPLGDTLHRLYTTLNKVVHIYLLTFNFISEFSKRLQQFQVFILLYFQLTC